MNRLSVPIKTQAFKELHLDHIGSLKSDDTGYQFILAVIGGLNYMRRLVAYSSITVCWVLSTIYLSTSSLNSRVQTIPCPRLICRACQSRVIRHLTAILLNAVPDKRFFETAFSAQTVDSKTSRDLTSTVNGRTLNPSRLSTSRRSRNRGTHGSQGTGSHQTQLGRTNFPRVEGGITNSSPANSRDRDRSLTSTALMKNHRRPA